MMKITVLIKNMLIFSVLVNTTVLFAQTKPQKKMNEMWGDVTVKNTAAMDRSNAQWFNNSKYAMFIHWGLYSQAANQWQGKTYYGIGEWLMNTAKTSIGDYEKLAKQFNPVKFNARAWVQLAKEAGMKYIVVTAKHHDGFAMFKSSNPYNVVDATPFKRDPMKELAIACKEEGIKLGFYYSQTQDWHEINSWSNDQKNITFEQYFKDKCLPQVKELLTNYGPISLIWFDTPNDMTKEQSQTLVDLVKKNQPQALINSRIGNGVGDYSTYGDHEIPSSNVPGLWEAVNTSNDSWGYAWYDKNWKGPTEIATDLVSVVARGGNFMLNVGPRADGTMPETNARFLKTTGEWLKKHSEAIYGAKPSPWLTPFSWGDCTASGKKLYLFVSDWTPGKEIWLPGLKSSIKSVTMSKGKEVLAFNKDADSWLHIKLPLRLKKELLEVITLELKDEPKVEATLGINPIGSTTLLSDFANTKGARKGKAGWMEKFGEWKHKTNIESWSNDRSYAEWSIDVKHPGQYFVNLEYNAWKEADGNEWDLVTQDGEKLRLYTIETTGASAAQGGRYRFRNIRMGIVDLKKAGKQVLKLTAASDPKGGGMQLHAIHLSPVE
jgi:alpha-L-fucosidase